MVLIRSILVSILGVIAFDSMSQCDLKGKRGENKLIDADQFPYTTFYRNDPNGSFTYNSSLEDAMDTVKVRLSNLIKNGSGLPPKNDYDQLPFNVYKELFDLAKKQTKPYLNGTDEKEAIRQQEFSWQLKAKGFILLCTTDLGGNAMHTDSLAKLRTQIESMFADIDYNYNILHGTVSHSHHVSKNLIHYLQAYDLLMTDAHLNRSQTRIEEVQCIGNDLQKLVGEFFLANKLFPSAGIDNITQPISEWELTGGLATLYRNNDNHTLQTAAVLGLASVVLNNHTHNRLHPNQHPNKWASTAMWRVDKTMWEVLGRNESDGHGFAEGPYYFKYSYENLVPFFMAQKNGHEDEKINKYMLPYFTLKGYLSPLGHLITGRTIEYNFVDDPRYDKLFEWANDIQEPNGDLPTIDNTWSGTNFIGLAGFRNLDWCSNPNMSYQDPDNAHVDLRAEFVAAAVDGFYKRMYQQRHQAFEAEKVFDDRSMVLRSSGSADDVENMQYLYTNNLKSHNNWTNSKYEHNHHDIGSFVLTVGESKLVIDPHFYGYDFRNNIDEAWSHNSIYLQDDPPIGNFTNLKPNEGHFTRPAYNSLGGYRSTTISNLQFEGNSDYTASREFVVKDYRDYIYVIRDNIEYDGNATHTSLADKRFSIYIHGNGFTGDYEDKVGGAITTDSSFLLELLGGDSLKAIWSKPCHGPDSSTSYGLAAFFTAHTLGDSANFSSSKLKWSFPLPASADQSDYYQHHNTMQVYIDGSRKVQFRTVLAPYRCTEGPDDIEVIDSNDLLALWVNKREIGQEKCAIAFNKSEGEVRTMFFPNKPNSDSLSFEANELDFCFDFDTSAVGYCEMHKGFRTAEMRSGSLVSFRTDTFIEADKNVGYLYYHYYDHFKYTGRIITQQNNTNVTFYLPDVPAPQLSLMEETNGLTYQYDTARKEITLTLTNSGEYDFDFVPSSPCVTSCFFPPDSIHDTFYFDHGFTAHLGHELPIVQQGGWLDITNGSKMVICENAILRNRDSLTLDGDEFIDTLKESTPLRQTYKTVEGAAYRESFGFGSVDWTILQNSKRSMIIVEKDGALVLKDSSVTHVGCGATILVRSGGTLKIEDGADLTIGGDCRRNWGEIIVEDSGFVCIEDSAKFRFYKSEYDSSDRHIFFISMNPQNPAIVGVGDSSNATPSNDCIGFCDLKDSFPTHGIDNHIYGWFNVGKPRAWFDADTVVCEGKNVWLNGTRSLNETRFRISVCEYDKSMDMCIGSTTDYPNNGLDTFYGGRIGLFNLTDTAQLLREKTYSVTLTVLNDCNESAQFSRVIELPAELVADVEGDTLMCGGQGVVKAHGLNSLGIFDSLSWEIWEYVPFPEYDSTEYYDNADSIIVFTDTILTDINTIDTILTYSIPFYFNDTLDSDSFHFAKYYQSYFDTTIVAANADTFQLDSMYYEAGKKYFVHLTLYNNCAVSHDTLIVRMRPGPEVDAGPDKYIAASHSSVTNTDPELEGSVTGYSGTPTWTPTSYLSSSTILNPVANPTSTTVYTLSATDAYGCVNTDSTTVFIDTFANAGADTLICYDDSAKVGVPLFAGNYDFNWSPGTWVSDSTIGEPYAYPDPNGTPRTIRVKVTNNTNLVEWDDIVIYADSTVDPTFSQMGGIAYDVIFTITENQVINENFTWVWGDGWINGTGNNPGHTYPPVPSSSYYTCVSYVNACGAVQWCDTVKFDALGNHIPTPPTPNTSNVEDISVEYIFNVAPNPFQKKTAISYSIVKPFNEAQIEIYGIDGKRVQTIPLQAKSGTVNLNMENYESGMYYAKLVIDGSTQQVKKLILNH